MRNVPDAAKRPVNLLINARTKDFALRVRDLNPVFEVGGKPLVLDTAALAAVPLEELKKPTANLGAQSAAVVAALDALFGAY